MHFFRRIAKEKKQSHVKHEMISKQEYIPFTTLDGDTSKYNVEGFDPNVMVPEERSLQTEEEKEDPNKRNGLENFMDFDE